MVVSAIYLMDSKGKILISRNYRGDVTRANADKCAGVLAALRDAHERADD